MRSPLNIGIRITGLDQAKADLQQFARGGQRSFEELSAEAKKLSGNMATTTQALLGVANRTRSLAAEMDPAGAAAIRLRQSLTDLERAAQANIISGKQKADLEVFLRQRYDETAASVNKYSAANKRLTETFDPATASARRMEKEISDLNLAVKLGVNIVEGYDVALARIKESHDEAAMAAKRDAQAQAELAAQLKRTQEEMIAQARARQAASNAQSGINESFGIGAPAGRSAAQSASVFEEEFRRQEAEARVRAQAAAEIARQQETIARARAAQAASNAQSGINQSFGIGATGKSAAASASVFAEDFAQQEEDAKQLAQATKEAAAEQERLTASAQKYKDALEPLNAALRVYMDEVGRINDLAARTMLTESQRQASIMRSTAAFEEQARKIQAASPAGKAAADAAKEQERLATVAQKYKDALNPLLPLQRTYRTQLTEISQAAAAGLLNENQRTQAVQRSKDAFTAQVLALRSGSDAAEKVGISSGRSRIALMQFNSQINDVATQLASGNSPFTILIQQGGQFVEAFAAGGGPRKVLTDFAALIGRWITPTTVAVAGLVAATAAVAALVVRAGTNANELRQLGVSLEGVGRGALVSASGMAEMAKQMRDLGVARADANKIANDVARNPQLNPAFRSQIVTTGADVGARLGVSTKEGIEAVTAALSDNADAVIKLGIATGALDKNQIANITTMQKSGRELEARNKAFQQLGAGTAGAADRAKTEWEKTFLALGAAWDNFVTKLTDTAFIKNLSTIMKGQLKEITDFLDAVSKWMESKGGPTLPSTAPPATGGRVGAGGAGGFTGYGGTVPITPIVDERARLSEAEVKLSIDMDPRAVELFELTKQVTGELGVRVTPHGFTTGSHARGSMHYPGNTSSGMGQAIDYVFPGIGYNQVPDEATRARYERFNSTFARLAQERYGITADQGQNFNPYDPGHVAARGLPRLTPLPPTGPDLEGQRARASTAVYAAAAGAGAALPDPEKARQLAAALAAANLEATRSIETAKASAGPGKAALEAYWGTYLPLVQSTGDALHAHDMATVAAAKAFDLYNVELARGVTAEELTIKSERSVAEALKTSEAAANAAAAAGAAQSEVFQKGGDAAAIAQRKLAGEAAKTSQQLQRTMNENVRKIDVLKLEDQLSGQTAETIAQQVSHLEAKQALQRQGVDLASAEGQAYLKSNDALAEAVKKHADVVREQQRVDDMYRQIGSTIESAIGNVIDGIFDPKKAVDWGKAVKDMAKGLFKDIAMSTVGKPLVGSLLSTIGASPSVVQQYGTLGGTSGLLSTGGLFGGSGGIGTLLQGGGFLKDLFPETTKMFSGGLSGIGGSLGFAQTVPGLSESSISSLGNLIGIEPSSLGYLSNSFTVPGSVFGSTTLGGALGGIGGGFAAGSILNSLVGGKSTGGMIGSGLGAAAGTLLFGPLGGLLGGAAGGLLGGMFGNSKPSNASAGANIDLSQFRITSGFAGGNQQIDQQMAQMGQSLQSFMDVLKSTGGKLAGNVLLQSGVNTGITADSSLAGYEGRFSLGKDSTSALQTIERALANAITGVSDTMRKVLDATSDPAALEANIAFANSYDELAKASEDAFASIENGKTQIGPFETAMQQITVTFGNLTEKATEFGLAVKPVSDALVEATSRLKGDFLDALEAAGNEATGKGFVNQIKDLSDAYIKSTKEAAAIGLGLDQATGDKLGKLFMDQVNALLKGLTADQLKQVVEAFTAADAQKLFGGPLSLGADTPPEDPLIALNEIIVQLAESMQIATDASTALADAQAAAADALQRGKAAFTQIADLLNSLQVTPSTFQSPEDAIAAANSTFFDLFNKASEGSVDALEGLAGASQDYINAIEAYYGSSQAGQDTVAMIEKGLQDLLDMNPALKPEDATVAGLNNVTAAVNTTTDAVTDVGAGVNGTTAGLQTSTTQLVKSNYDTADALIAQNNDSLDALIADSKATLAASTATTLANTKNLIDVQTDNTNSMLAYDAVVAGQLTTANAEQSQLIRDQAAAQGEALIAQGNAATDSILGGYSDSTAAMIADGQASTQALLDDAAVQSAAITAQSQAATGALLAQGTADKDALIADAQAQTAAMNVQAAADTASLIADAQAATATLVAQAELDKAAVLADSQAATAALLVQSSIDKDAIVANAQTATDALLVQAAADTAAHLADSAARTADLVAQSDTSTANIIQQAAVDTAAHLTDSAARTAELVAQSDASTGNIIQQVADSGNLVSYYIGTYGDAVVQEIGIAQTAIIQQVADSGNLVSYFIGTYGDALIKEIGIAQKAIIDNATDVNAASIIKAMEINSKAIIDNSTDTNTVTLVSAIELERDAIIESQRDKSKDIVDAIGLARDTIVNNATEIIGANTINAIGVARDDTHSIVEVYGKGIITSIETWSGWIIKGASDGFVAAGSVIAVWGGAIVTALLGPMGVVDSIVKTDTSLANSSIQAAYNVHNSWAIIFAGWMSSQMTNDSAMAAYIADMANRDAINIMTQINTDANSIIKANATYGSNDVIAQDNWGANNAYWLNEINNWSSGTYLNTLSMVSLLKDILAQLRLQTA